MKKHFLQSAFLMIAAIIFSCTNNAKKEQVTDSAGIAYRFNR